MADMQKNLWKQEEELAQPVAPAIPDEQLRARQDGLTVQTVKDHEAEQASRLNDAAQADAIRKSLRLGVKLNFENLFEYVDAKTGYKVDHVNIEPVGDDETQMRYEKMPFQIKKSTKIDFDIVDSSGLRVGHYTMRALYVEGGIMMELDDTQMYISGTGFGSRFQRAVEEKYRQVGITAIVRGCGLSVGRYEGAKNGFDFLNDMQRQRFIKAFCAFLNEKGIQTVTFGGENFLIDQLAQKLRTPQDILAVEADEVDCVMMDREWSTERNEWAIKNKRTEKFFPGKAFFLDQGSDAKRNLDDEFYSGKWSGIKRLA